MILIATSFFAVLLITFAAVTFATAPSRIDKALQGRLAAVTVAKSGGGAAALESGDLLRKTATSRFDWIGQSISKYISMQSLQKWISQAALNTTASALFVQTAAAAGIGFLITLFLATFISAELSGAAVCATLPWARIAFARYRRLRAFEKALPHAIDMMARSLRARHSTAGAIEIMAQGAPEPASSEFSEVFRQQNFGLPLRDALMQLLDRVPSQDLRVLVTAILVQRETGGNLVEILDRTVMVIRERQRIHGEIRTQTAQGRMTGWILTALPVVMLVLINLTDPGYSKILFTDPTGRKLIYVGIAFIALGAFFIRKIINSIEV